MSSQTVGNVGWLVHLMACHYIIRRIPNQMTRMILAMLPSVLLTYVTCYDLPRFQMASIIPISLCWIMSLRIFQLIVISPNENCPFYSFVLRTLWTVFPLKPSTELDKQWPIICDFISGLVKLVINHWVFRWLLHCGPGDNYARIIMLSTIILTSSHIPDILIGVVRIITRDQYTLLSISNFPLFSTSLREFWGRRYNRVTSTVLHDSIFEPIKSYVSSPMIAAMSTFTISGLLHAHINYVILGDLSTLMPTFTFFFLHGIACCMEKHMGIRLPAPLGWLLTHSFLLLTLPLSARMYARHELSYQEQNSPPLFNSKWMPRFSVPDTCF